MNYDDLIVSKKNHRFQDMLDDEEEDDNEDGNDYYEDSNQIDEQFDQSQELKTIYEAEEESSQTMKSFEQSQRNEVQKKEVGYLISSTYDDPVIFLNDSYMKLSENMNYKQQMLDKQRKQNDLELKFQLLLREQADYLLKQDKSEKIKRKLARTIKPEKIEDAVNVMLEKSLLLSPALKTQKVKSSHKVDQLNPKTENLILQIQQLKQQRNDDEEIIKTLKIQIHKMQDQNTTNNSSYVSRCSTKSKSEFSENDRLSEENNQLKKTINEERLSYKSQMSRAHKVQSALNKINVTKLQEERDELDSEKKLKELQKNNTDSTQLIHELRGKLKSQQVKITEQGDAIVLKNKEILTLQTKLQNKSSEQFTARINELEEQLKSKSEELDETKEDMMIDNQINMLFPKYGSSVVSLMNFIMLMEVSKNKKSLQLIIHKKVESFWINCSNAFQDVMKKLGQFVQYYVTKNPIKHPTNQELIKHAMIKIRASPNVLEKTIQNQHNAILNMQKTLDCQSREIETFKEFERDHCARNAKIEELHRVDKIQLANNFMMKILKKEAQDRNDPNKEEIPEIGVVKEYMDLIYKSAIPAEIKIISKSPQQKKPQTLENINQVRPPSCTKLKRHEKRNEQPTMKEKQQEQTRLTQLQLKKTKK